MAEDVQRQPNGRFVKGHRRIAARVKGIPNKISRDLREGILDAAISHGADGNGKGGLSGCCDWLLRNHTKAFVPLLVRLLPLQVSGQVNHQTKLNVQIVSVPRGMFYNRAGELVPRGDPSLVIEHIADEVAARNHDEVENPTAMDAPPPPRDDAGTPVMQLRAVSDDDGGDSAA